MLDESSLAQRLGAEFIGTAFLVFIGVGSVPATLISTAMRRSRWLIWA